MKTSLSATLLLLLCTASLSFAQTQQRPSTNIGFIYPLGLKQTPVPEPGDIAYFQKNQHHAIVASVNSDGTVSLINGNGTGGAVSESRPDIEDVTAFYSIGTLL
jgi:hypothetical protein